MTFTDTPHTHTRHPARDRRALRIGGVVAATIAGLALLTGAGLLAIDHTERDKHGYYRAPAVAVASNGYAISSAGLDLGDLDSTETFVVHQVLGRVRIQATTKTGKPIFVGIARRGELGPYLAGSSRTLVSEVRDDHTAVVHDLAGGSLPTTPDRQSFWLAKASGSGELSLSWSVKEGDWGLAVLNADGSPRPAADVRLAAKTNVLLWLGLALLGFGFVAGGGGGAMLFAAREV